MIKTYFVPCANSTAQVLDEQVIAISGAWIASTSSLAVGSNASLTPVTGTPGTTQIQFTGTVTSPSNAINLGYAPGTGNIQLVVKAIPAAGNIAGY